MATSSCACSYSLSKSPLRNSRFTRGNYHRTVLLSSVANGRATTPYKNTLIFEATRLLGPPARFEASKLKVDFRGEEVDKFSRIVPRIYTLSHCDFTANLTLTISNILGIDQLRGWYNKDDVVAEWKEVKGNMCMHVHCYVSGPNLLFDLTAEFRYHIFSKELPLVLQAVLHGDSDLFKEHPELMDSIVWVYFHSSSPKYNRVECWGALKDAAQKKQEDQLQNLLDTNNKKWGSPKSFFQALFTFLL
ncbi:hypothetical protein V2J09_009088 [Rumex salicifolius]